MPTPDSLTIIRQRLLNHRLTGEPCRLPEEVVRWYGAVQSQDYAGARWALAMRMRGPAEEGAGPGSAGDGAITAGGPNVVGPIVDGPITDGPITDGPITDGPIADGEDDEIEKAFNEGRILRTHAVRPTWHFVTPEDIRWILSLTAPRIKPRTASVERANNVDEPLMARGSEVIVKALEGGKALTREELSAALAREGIEATGMRLGFIIFRAEIEALVCSGPRRGKQFTYMLLEERAPNARLLDRDEALAEFTRRYFRSHGPATPHDFVWYSDLTLADARRGLDMLGSELESAEFDGRRYWFSPDPPPERPARNSRSAQTRDYLLPNYDEYVSYDDHSPVSPVPRKWEDYKYFNPLVIDGQFAGSWRRTLKKKQVLIDWHTFDPLDEAGQKALHAAAARFGRYLGLEVVLV